MEGGKIGHREKRSSDGPNRWGGRKEYICSCCGKQQPFCWRCRCGFQICLQCMRENQWGMSGNSITWICPDCGRMCCL